MHEKEGFCLLKNIQSQHEDCFGRRFQRRAVKEDKVFRQGKNWQIAETFYDCSVSGDNGTDLERDAFNEMMAKMKSNGIKTFVVSDSDRFSRSILTAEIMKQDCREHGISAFDASTGMDLAISKMKILKSHSLTTSSSNLGV